MIIYRSGRFSRVEFGYFSRILAVLFFFDSLFKFIANNLFRDPFTSMIRLSIVSDDLGRFAFFFFTTLDLLIPTLVLSHKKKPLFYKSEKNCNNKLLYERIMTWQLKDHTGSLPNCHINRYKSKLTWASSHKNYLFIYMSFRITFLTFACLYFDT